MTRRLALILAFAWCSNAWADVEECQNAINTYNSAIGDVADALRIYGQCISGSHGHDDCSVEFSTLQSAQSDFESAVSSYESDCQ